MSALPPSQPPFASAKYEFTQWIIEEIGKKHQLSPLEDVRRIYELWDRIDEYIHARCGCEVHGLTGHEYNQAILGNFPQADDQESLKAAIKIIIATHF